MTGQGAVTHRLRCDDFRQSMTFFLRVVAQDEAVKRRDDAVAWTVEGEFEKPKANEDEGKEEAVADGGECPSLVNTCAFVHPGSFIVLLSEAAFTWGG